MSMIMSLTRLSDANIEKIINNPVLVWKVVAPDNPEIYEEALAEQSENVKTKPTNTLMRLFGSKKSVSSDVPNTGIKMPVFMIDSKIHEGETTDIDKAWHGIHYLLTGSVWEGDEPQNFLLCGGREVGEIDVGYGPARAITYLELQVIAKVLENISDDDLLKKYDSEALTKADIYPAIWDDKAAEEENKDYIKEYFGVLNEFIKDTISKKLGIVISLA